MPWCLETFEEGKVLSDLEDIGGKTPAEREALATLDFLMMTALFQVFGHQDTEIGRKIRAAGTTAIQQAKIFRGRQLLFVIAAHGRVDIPNMRTSTFGALVSMTWQDSDVRGFLTVWDALTAEAAQGVSDSHLRDVLIAKVRNTNIAVLQAVVRRCEDARELSCEETLQFLLEGVRSYTEKERPSHNDLPNPGRFQSNLGSVAPILQWGDCRSWFETGEGRHRECGCPREHKEDRRGAGRLGSGAPAAPVAPGDVGGSSASAAPIPLSHSGSVPLGPLRAKGSGNGKDPLMGVNLKTPPCAFYNVGGCKFPEEKCQRAHRVWTEKERLSYLTAEAEQRGAARLLEAGLLRSRRSNTPRSSCLLYTSPSPRDS